VELVANGIRGGTAGNKGLAPAAGSGAAGVGSGAAGVGFGLLFVLTPLPPFLGIAKAPAGAAAQMRQHKMKANHSQRGKYEPEEPEKPELLPLLSMLDLLSPEDSAEPESLPKELDNKELSKECEEPKELLKEPPEDSNHDMEEESDESQAVSVVVF